VSVQDSEEVESADDVVVKVKSEEESSEWKKSQASGLLVNNKTVLTNWGADPI